MDHPTKYYSDKQEKLISSMLGWSVVSGSGSRSCHPGDVTNRYWLGECKTKTSVSKTISFSFNHWNKICGEATAMKKVPALFVDDGSQTASSTWVLLRRCCAAIFNIKFEEVAFKCTNSKSISFKQAEAVKALEAVNSNRPKVLKPCEDTELCIMHFSTFCDLFGEI